MENKSNMKWTPGLFKAASAMLRAFRAHLVAFGGSDAQADFRSRAERVYALRMLSVQGSGLRA